MTRQDDDAQTWEIWQKSFRDIAAALQQQHDTPQPSMNLEKEITAIADICLQNVQQKDSGKSAEAWRDDTNEAEYLNWKDTFIFKHLVYGDEIIAVLAQFTQSCDNFWIVRLARERMAAKHAPPPALVVNDAIAPTEGQALPSGSSVNDDEGGLRK